MAGGNSFFPTVQAKNLAFVFDTLSLTSHIHSISWFFSENYLEFDQIIYLTMSFPLPPSLFPAPASRPVSLLGPHPVQSPSTTSPPHRCRDPPLLSGPRGSHLADKEPKCWCPVGSLTPAPAAALLLASPGHPHGLCPSSTQRLPPGGLRICHSLCREGSPPRYVQAPFPQAFAHLSPSYPV